MYHTLRSCRWSTYDVSYDEKAYVCVYSYRTSISRAFNFCGAPGGTKVMLTELLLLFIEKRGRRLLL